MNKKILRWNFVFQYGYVLTNIVNSIILLPLYLKNIDTDTLGIWLATGNILAWMTLADPGVGDVLQQKIAELRGKKEFREVGTTIGSGFVASSLILVVSVIVGFAFYFLLGIIINKDVAQYPNLDVALVLSIIATGMSLVSFSMSGINQGLHNASQVAIASLLANVLFLVTNICFLFMGLGIISIAFANLCRALFINIYNITSMHRVLKKQELKVRFEFGHFKRFMRIFSFTSASRIIGGFSASIDMIILARFISPGLITIYEINKRPINMTGSLIGRHSVALMPLVSHGKGSDDHRGIISLINQQFRFYSYAALFTSFLFWLTYENLINAWTGAGHYAGSTVVHLLIANFFFNLISFFMSNMGYALGDIKMNSLVNIVKGLLVAPLLFFAAKHFAVEGMLIVTLSATLLIDLGYFTHRLYRLGYLQLSLLKNIGSVWILLVPAGLLMAWGCKTASAKLVPANMYLNKLIIDGGLFSMGFILMVLLLDKEMRDRVKYLQQKFISGPLYRFMGA